jgi:hypothetical protein
MTRRQVSKVAQIITAAERVIYAMEASIYFAPTIEDDGPYVVNQKRAVMQMYRSQEIRALAELKQAVYG